MGERMYTEWRRRLERDVRKECKEMSVKWNDMVVLYEKIDNLVKSNNGNQSVNDVISKFYTYVTGVYFTLHTMRMWQDTVSKIREVCIDDKDNLFRCPDNMTNERRWLFIHEDNMLLMFTMMAMYDGPYKKLIDTLYDAAHGEKPTRKSTYQKAEHLAEKYKIDILDVISKDIRHAAAHMSFWPNPAADEIIVQFINGKQKIVSTYVYTHDELISIYMKIRDSFWLLYVAVMYWWKLEYGPMRLFDDEFFRADNGEAVCRAALGEMLRDPNNLNIEAWNDIVERARGELVLKTN